MKMFWTGMFVSFLYFLCLGLIIHFLKLNLMLSWNEFGDFLAGAFSPVAFLWLVLGYLQQQKELQQNTKALELQATELKNSVEQYKEMVEVAREQLMAEKELSQQQQKIRELENKPDLSIKETKYFLRAVPDVRFAWNVHNDGREARNVNIHFSPSLGHWDEISFKKIDTLGVKLPVNDMKTVDLPQNLSITISYESVFGKKYVKIYELVANESCYFDIVKESDL
jgi:hypothetical protein